LAVAAAGAAAAFAVIVAFQSGSVSAALALPFGLAIVAVIVRRPYVGLWLVILFTQLDAAASLIFRGLPVSAAKALTAATILGVVVVSYREPRSERLGPDHTILRLALMFATVLLASFLFVEDRSLGVWSVRRMASLIILLYLVVRLVGTVSLARGIVLAVLVSTLVSALVLIADWTMGSHLVARAQAAVNSQWLGISRSSGASDYNPTTAATMTLTGTACAMILALRWRRWRMLTAATAVAGSAAVVLSFARSSGLVLGLLLVWLVLKFVTHRRFALFLSGAAVAAVVAAAVIPQSYWERQATLTDLRSDISLRRRVGYNLIGLHVLAQHPILGVGPGNYKVYYMNPEYRWMPGRGLIPRQLHNMYLEVASETGLVGFACFAGILAVAWASLNRLRIRGPTQEIRVLAEAIHFGFTGLLLASLFVPNEYNKYVWIFAGLGAAMDLVARRHEKEARQAGG